MLCVLILYSEWQIFFEKLFMAILFTLRVFARNLLKGNRRRNTFCIYFLCLARGSNPDITSNKRTHYSLDYGDLCYKLMESSNIGSRQSSNHRSSLCPTQLLEVFNSIQFILIATYPTIVELGSIPHHC